MVRRDISIRPERIDGCFGAVMRSTLERATREWRMSPTITTFAPDRSRPCGAGEPSAPPSGIDGYIYCVDLKTGWQKWRYKAGREVYGSLLVSDCVVYIGNHDGKPSKIGRASCRERV